jgi:hypothetical protein
LMPWSCTSIRASRLGPVELPRLQRCRQRADGRRHPVPHDGPAGGEGAAGARHRDQLATEPGRRAAYIVRLSAQDVPGARRVRQRSSGRHNRVERAGHLQLAQLDPEHRHESHPPRPGVQARRPWLAGATSTART